MVKLFLNKTACFLPFFLVKKNYKTLPKAPKCLIVSYLTHSTKVYLQFPPFPDKFKLLVNFKMAAILGVI